jgi:DNA-binding transcriptional MerR regulator
MAVERKGDERWTLDELSARVALALSVDYDGQPSGRVRDVPDGRIVRYYTTLGLVDRPVQYDGRVALYSSRHLLQILGIKRLQQEGASLAQVQDIFLHLDEPGLERLAEAPAEALSPAMQRAPAPRDQAAANEEAADKGAKKAAAREPKVEEGRERFWNAAPAPAVTDAVVTSKSSRSSKGKSTAARSKPETLTGVALSDATVLLAKFSRELDEADVDALRTGAAPLLEMLERRGLL